MAEGQATRRVHLSVATQALLDARSYMCGKHSESVGVCTAWPASPFSKASERAKQRGSAGVALKRLSVVRRAKLGCEE